ncbi:MAG: class I SAM-dependent methyltransferase [Saprospiraceae bacterium]|nr:class I SAM-dependent methyltransferase [Saprospiraceae bacterium]
MPIAIKNNPVPINYQIVVEWDVTTWSRALRYWEIVIEQQQLSLQLGLELGSRHGGLSYFFAKKYGAQVFCSDYHFPSEKAHQLHEDNNLESLISYHDVDATEIPFEDNSFDFVVFKSMLGAVGAKERYHRIELTIQEIYRVLRPGGVLFFAENMDASPLHRFARRQFIPWGTSWYYVSYSEMHQLLGQFCDKKIHTTGFFGVFIAKPKWMQTIVSKLDEVLFFIPNSWKYVGYGYAVK